MPAFATNMKVTFKVQSSNIYAYDAPLYTVTVANGEQTQNVTFTEADIANAVTVDVPLSGTDATEEVTITVSHKETGSVAQTYTLKVDKLPPVATVFAVDPADATIYLTDDISKARIYPEADGSYILNTDGSYTYVISKTGYVTKTAQFVASEENKTITVALEKAPDSTLKDIATDGDWLQFRADNNNNGVVNVKTPIKAEDAVLEWANKIGEGFDSGATGCPIIVGGYLYTYAGDAIHKVNKETGEVVKSGKMAGSSSFAINSPTYGNGMIFVALSNGRVQAFDAENLTSLWVYKDALGGQPNCPICGFARLRAGGSLGLLTIIPGMLSMQFNGDGCIGQIMMSSSTREYCPSRNLLIPSRPSDAVVTAYPASIKSSAKIDWIAASSSIIKMCSLTISPPGK